MAAPSPVPVTIEPHLLAFIWCRPTSRATGSSRSCSAGAGEDDEEIARNVSPFTVEPGKFTYRLVRGELDFDDYGPIVAHCRIDRGPGTSCPSRCSRR